MMPCLLADDLSGALEAGAAFHARGWRVVLPLTEGTPPVGAGELRVITSESRNLSPPAAATAVRSALAGRPAGAQLLFKKIDSTLRGPVAAELKALIEELTPPLVIVCPANPAAERTVRDGILRVRGVPLAETDFRFDPAWPAAESNLRALLLAQGLTPAGQVGLKDLRDGGLPSLLAAAVAGSGSHVLLSDAETEADLATLVKTVRTIVPLALLVGSGALAAVLARELAPPGRPVPAWPVPSINSLLILCGSRHPASRRQLDDLSEKQPGSVVPFVAGVGEETVLTAAVRLLRTRGVAAIRFESNTPATADSAGRLLAGIVRFSGRLFAQVSPEALFLTGGETAWAVCRALQGTGLEIVAELEPGVVLSRMACRNRPDFLIITKPGGFGSVGIMSGLASKLS